MGILYNLVWENASLSAQVDIFTIETAVGVPILIHEISLSQDDIDITEHWKIKWHRNGTTVGSGGGTPSRTRLIPGETATVSTTITSNNTTKSATEGDVLFVDAWTQPEEYIVGFPLKRRLPVAGDSQLIIELETTPSESVKLNGNIIWEELK